MQGQVLLSTIVLQNSYIHRESTKSCKHMTKNVTCKRNTGSIESAKKITCMQRVNVPIQEACLQYLVQIMKQMFHIHNSL